MSTERESLIVRCWCEPNADDRTREVAAPDGRLEDLFLLRLARTRGSMTQRCLIRHVASGRELYVQSGAGLSRFIDDCLRVGARSPAYGGVMQANAPAGAAGEEDHP